MNEKTKPKKFTVTLDSSKCVSYTIDSIKYIANRAFFKSEDKLQKFREAGVFLIGEVFDKPKPKAEPLSNKGGDEGASENDNIKGNENENSESGDDQSLLPGGNEGGDGNGSPSGTITTSSIT